MTKSKKAKKDLSKLFLNFRSGDSIEENKPHIESILDIVKNTEIHFNFVNDSHLIYCLLSKIPVSMDGKSYSPLGFVLDTLHLEGVIDLNNQHLMISDMIYSDICDNASFILLNGKFNDSEIVRMLDDDKKSKLTMYFREKNMNLVLG